MKRLVLCADDYGMSDGVCDAIESLIAARRLSATSVMTGFPEWRSRAAGLAEIAAAKGVEVGLHLTLTDHEPVSPMRRFAPGGNLPNLKSLLIASQLRTLPAAELAQEIKAQFDAFENAFGAPPAYVDGHQHVHVFPVIRRLVIAEVLRRGNPSCWMRTTVEPVLPTLRRGVAAFKASVLNVLGWRHARMTDAAGIPRNDGFRGVYDFGLEVPYGRIFDRFLDDAGVSPARLLIFSHPGIVDGVLKARSGLAEARAAEYAYFASPQFQEDCARHEYAVTPFGAAQ